MDCYTVFKQTHTHADVLAAVGAADVLRDLEPRVVEFEDRFEIQLRRQFRRSDLEAIDPGFSFFVRPIKTAPEEAEGLASPGAVPESRMYTILRRMKAHGGPNQLLSSYSRLRREAWEARVWEGLHGGTRFVFDAPLVQLFNPQAAKGYALLKPSGTSRRDKTKNSWAEPFLEWLRYRGYFAGSAGWFASGDLRLFCPIPVNIRQSEFAPVIAAFRELRLGGTGIKLDCRAVLGLARLLIQCSNAHRRPNESIRGMWVTHYKDMGQAHTIMGMEQLAIPDWFELRSSQQAQLWLKTIEEHDTVLRRLNDSHSDEFTLLKQYRHTLQTRSEESLSAFLEFLAAYSSHLFRQRARDNWLLPQFTSSGVLSILRCHPQLRGALLNPGFLAIAAALRCTTTGAQAARYNGRADHREVRYGMLSAIRRAGLDGKRELAAQVSAFVDSFNRESARRCSFGVRSGTIRSAELGAFFALIQRLPSSLPAGSLLCAVAGCTRGQKKTASAESEFAIPA